MSDYQVSIAALSEALDRLAAGHTHPAAGRDKALIAAALDSRQRTFDKLSELRAALAFARSVIKSGEPWTETCSRVIDGALNYSEGSQ